jgi:CRISPR-associated protein Cmr6
MEKTQENRSFYVNCSSPGDIHCALRDAAKSNVLNIGLYIDKFVEWKKENEKCSPRNQIEELKRICGIESDRLSIPTRLFPIKLYETYKKRRSSFFSGLEDSGYAVLSKEKDVFWRLIVNLGAPSVYETSLLLHRNYSIPFIPGSSVKGVAYHYAVLGEIKDDDVRRIFGNEKQKGAVDFFDAFPIIDNEKDFFVLDIMNVHYQKYYQEEEKEPGDWMNPNPVFFFALENIKLEFAVASEKSDSNLAKKALNLIEKALSKEGIGIGSKTSIGYGYFSEE